MDDALALLHQYTRTKGRYVLILVVMDDALAQTKNYADVKN